MGLTHNWTVFSDTKKFRYLSETVSAAFCSGVIFDDVAMVGLVTRLSRWSVATGPNAYAPLPLVCLAALVRGAMPPTQGSFNAYGSEGPMGRASYMGRIPKAMPALRKVHDWKGATWPVVLPPLTVIAGPCSA